MNDSGQRTADSCFVDSLVHQDSALVQSYRSSSTFRGSDRQIMGPPRFRLRFPKWSVQKEGREAVSYEVIPS